MRIFAIYFLFNVFGCYRCWSVMAPFGFWATDWRYRQWNEDVNKTQILIITQRLPRFLYGRLGILKSELNWSSVKWFSSAGMNFHPTSSVTLLHIRKVHSPGPSNSIKIPTHNIRVKIYQHVRLFDICICETLIRKIWGKISYGQQLRNMYHVPGRWILKIEPRTAHMARC